MPNCAAVLSETYQEISHFLCLSLAKVQRLTVIVSQSIMFCCCTAEELGKWQPLCRQMLLLETITMCTDWCKYCWLYQAAYFVCFSLHLNIYAISGNVRVQSLQLFYKYVLLEDMDDLIFTLQQTYQSSAPWRSVSGFTASERGHKQVGWANYHIQSKKPHHWSAYAWVNSNVLIYVVSSCTLGWHWVSAWWIPRAQSVKSSCGYQDSPDTHSPMINFPSSILWPAFTHQHQSNTSKYSEWLNAFSPPGILQTKMASEGK